MIANAPGEAEAVVKAVFIEIIKKKPADAPRLLAVANIEVLVAPLFKTRVIVRTERIARALGSAMPVNGVLVEAVVGREIETAAEPPAFVRARLFGDKEAHVAV